MATKNEKNDDAAITAEEAEKNGSGGGRRATADDFRAIVREEKVISLHDLDLTVKIRGLSVAQLDAINSNLGEGISEFRLMTEIAAAGMVEPEMEVEQLLELTPAIVLLIGGEVAALSKMDESAVSAVEKSVREG